MPNARFTRRSSERGPNYPSKSKNGSVHHFDYIDEPLPNPTSRPSSHGNQRGRLLSRLHANSAPSVKPAPKAAYGQLKTQARSRASAFSPFTLNLTQYLRPKPSNMAAAQFPTLDADEYFPPVPPPTPVPSLRGSIGLKNQMVRESDSASHPLPLSKLSTDLSFKVEKISPSTDDSPITEGYGSNSSNSPANDLSPPGLAPRYSLSDDIDVQVAPIASTLADHEVGAYSLAGLAALDVLIPSHELPDDLYVHDPHRISQTIPTSVSPIRYIRVNAELTVKGQEVSPLRATTDHNPPRGTATLYLSGGNQIARSAHSDVYRAPIEFAYKPADGVPRRSRVVAKIPVSVCGAHSQINQEARMYQAVPEDYMKTYMVTLPRHMRGTMLEYVEENKTKASTSGANPSASASNSAPSQETDGKEKQPSMGKGKSSHKGPVKKMLRSLMKKTFKSKDASSAGENKPPPAQLRFSRGDLAQVEVPPTIPRFYGYYVPVLEGHEDGLFANDCGPDGDHQAYDVPCPILLIEDCGDPVDPAGITKAQKMLLLMLLNLFHESGFIHGSLSADKLLIQPGPLSAPPTERSLDEPSFRIVDFGLGDGFTLTNNPLFRAGFCAMRGADFAALWDDLGVDIGEYGIDEDVSETDNSGYYDSDSDSDEWED
ncbi:hypothetical protein C8Q74DRAFT_1281204 [Fomes fomentarius]|nr:hypothetical protein C8Q74DRAFT_1281204 [Fomes fomentarius]